MSQERWDRRRFPRWRAWGWLSGWIGEDMKVSVMNISQGGVLIEHPSQMRPGTVCLVNLSLRGEKASLKGRVVRSGVYRYETWPVGERSSICRTGLDLIEVPDLSRRLVRNYITFLEEVAAKYRNRSSAVA